MSRFGMLATIALALGAIGSGVPLGGPAWRTRKDRRRGDDGTRNETPEERRVRQAAKLVAKRGDS